jgi:hypothetical protein
MFSTWARETKGPMPQQDSHTTPAAFLSTGDATRLPLYTDPPIVLFYIITPYPTAILQLYVNRSLL